MQPMKPSIQKQVQLPWGKSVHMAFKGIRIEFRRSLLTALSVIFAMAFLSFVWTDADLMAALRRAAPNEVHLARQLAATGQIEPSKSTEQRRTILVAMSLIVCTVGISNAVAMSVTERFGQIGTMKCLGALNSFIARLFVLEALFLGLAGALIGDAVGMVLAIARHAVAYGAVVFLYLPAVDLATTGLYTILVGAAISLLGALYPAIVAARMEPVEAMRVTA
jgi:predicted lysophospholipase L1 biosynthesis ABC-type transport system permease subunit